MTTTQLIEKKKEEFDEKYDGHLRYGAYSGKLLKSFLHSFALDLIETVSEEIISKNLQRNGYPTEKYRKQLQREIKDQIINSIKK